MFYKKLVLKMLYECKERGRGVECSRARRSKTDVIVHC